MNVRYGGTEIDCPKCGRHGRFYRMRTQLGYVCQFCGHHIHPCAGTFLHRTHTPLHKWFFAMFLFSTSRHGVAAKELERQLGEDYLNASVTFGTDMGGMSVNVGAAFQTAADDYVDSVTIAASAGMGGATVGFSWYDNGDNVDGTYRSGTTGWTVGAKYSLGAITPGITYSSLECDNWEDQDEETALVLGASYAVGGGLSVFAEYLAMETTRNGVADDETLLMSGITLGF